MSFADMCRISRPRFWSYTAGTFLIGSLFGMTGFSGLWSPWFIVHFVYFLWFANLFIYGVNDWYDRDTDRFNKKKGTKEHLVQQKERRELFSWIWVSFALFVVLLVVWWSWTLFWLWFGFFFLSYFYSVPPLRFKARPFLDFLSNALYVFPGLIGFFFASGSLPSWPGMLAGWAWVGGMQLFSAVPDIKADARARLRTTAVVLRYRWSLVLVFALWLAAFVLAFPLLPWYLAVGAVYPLLPLLVLVLGLDIDRVYWWFPYINAFIGFLLFLGGALG